MMMTRSRFFARSCGSAEIPSSSGISISSTATSGLMRSIWLTASSPVRSDAATSMSCSAPIQREIRPRMTTESSTTITRNGPASRDEPGVELPANATLITHQLRLKRSVENKRRRSRSASRAVSDKADFLEFRRHDVLVERLHDVLVGARVQRARDMRDVVLGGAEHHLGLVATRHAPEMAEELVAVHHRHVPVEQDRVGQAALAGLQRLLTVLGFEDLEVEALQDPARNLADDAGIINDETSSHVNLLSPLRGHFQLQLRRRRCRRIRPPSFRARAR